jgi:hypothetical protein
VNDLLRVVAIVALVVVVICNIKILINLFKLEKLAYRRLELEEERERLEEGK